MDSTPTADERAVWARIEQWFDAIKAYDRELVEEIHGTPFVCMELNGTRLTREQHIALELGTSDIDARVTELRCLRRGDYVLTWGRQTLAGTIGLEDARVNAAARDGLDVAFTILWHDDGGVLRVMAMQASRVDG